MREIIFRGKCVNKEGKYRGTWLEGDFVYHNGMNPHKGYIYHRVQHPATGDYPTCHFLPVDFKTVGQFTGLCDKNGKKIFEGDIVKFKSGVTRSVVFDEHLAEFEFDKHDPVENHDGWALCCDHDFCEVVGNIHDNPELLKGE